MSKQPLSDKASVSPEAQSTPLIDTVKFAPEHLRAARGLLNWSREELKAASGVSMETIKNIEGGVWNPNEVSHQKLVDAFAKNGVEFIWLHGLSRYGLKVGGVMRVIKEEVKTKATASTEQSS